MRDVWETPISSLRREKGRWKKIKRVPTVHIVDSSEVPNVGRETEGACHQPIMKQAHMSKVVQKEACNGPSSLHRKTSQDISTGGFGSSKSSPEAPQNKSCPKKPQRQLKKIKSLKPCIMTMQRKRRKELGKGKSNNRGKDNTMAEEGGSKDDSTSNNKTCSLQTALNNQEGKPVYNSGGGSLVTSITLVYLLSACASYWGSAPSGWFMLHQVE
ncbi:hypothetical protein Ancab_005486 [Ancistrocladus abbreviatus]